MKRSENEKIKSFFSRDETHKSLSFAKLSVKIETQDKQQKLPIMIKT